MLRPREDVVSLREALAREQLPRVALDVRAGVGASVAVGSRTLSVPRRQRPVDRLGVDTRVAVGGELGQFVERRRSAPAIAG